MKFTLAWLSEHLKGDFTLDEIVSTLTRIGLEVESVTDPGERLRPFRIARIISARAHPDADRLRVLEVDAGEDPVQVVCGAHNARAGLVGVFAAPGTYIPGTNMQLEAGIIRGQASNGMMCSDRELEISDDHEGIIELEDDAPVGDAWVAWAGLDSPVVEIAVTPNRPDCASVVGIARDLAAAGLGEFVEARPKQVAGDAPCPTAVRLDLGEAPHLCPAFGLRLIKDVVNSPSPSWLQARLRAIGLRPISALVDITNYITHARGRPLHVFDADRISGDLVIRHARKGETLAALDGNTWQLAPWMCVIADDRGVVSLAGIMGGAATGCTPDTRNVLVESALWDPQNIARTGRHLGISSDARYRFERGVDPQSCLAGLELATAMILEFCGGMPGQNHLAGEIPQTGRSISFPFSEVERLTGLAMSDREIRATLTRLGFWISGSASEARVAAPSWRPDIHGKADLVEEVLRMHGMDNIVPVPMPERKGRTARLPLVHRRAGQARRVLAARAMQEIITWSFVGEGPATDFGGGVPELRLSNPLSAEMSDMRPSLLAGLADAARRNCERGSDDIALFEVGQIFQSPLPEGQKIMAAGLRHGIAAPGGGRNWRDDARHADLFDAKTDALAVLGAVGLPVEKLMLFTDLPSWYHPGRSGELRLGPKTCLARFGEMHPGLARKFDFRHPVVIFEIWLDHIPEPRTPGQRRRNAADLPSLMALTRDFAFVVDRGVPAEKILRAVRSADRQLIANVRIFDIYQSEELGPDKVSIGVDVEIQPRTASLTDARIDALGLAIIDNVRKVTGATLRGPAGPQ